MSPVNVDSFLTLGVKPSYPLFFSPTGACDFLRDLCPGCASFREKEGAFRPASRFWLRERGGTDPWRDLSGEEPNASWLRLKPPPLPHQNLSLFLGDASRWWPQQAKRERPQQAKRERDKINVLVRPLKIWGKYGMSAQMLKGSLLRVWRRCYVSKGCVVNG